MKIIVGSSNKSKLRSVEKAIEKLNIKDVEIIGISVESMVSSKPLNEETLLGAINRNNNLYQHCINNKIDFDMLLSIEGGYEQVLNNYFVTTYACVTTKDNESYVGKSNGLQISKKMYEHVKNGKSINKIIESLSGTSENKKDNGISGYLTNGIYRRDVFDMDAVLCALEAYFNKENYSKIDDLIGDDVSMEREKFLSSIYLIIKNENGEILLQRRQGTKLWPGFLALPAGHIDVCENAYEAAIREAKEELDIDIRIEDIVDTFVVNRKNKSLSPYYDVYFELSRYFGEIKINEPNKCSELVWSSIDNLPIDMIDFEKEAIEKNIKGIKFSCTYADNEVKLVRKKNN